MESEPVSLDWISWHLMSPEEKNEMLKSAEATNNAREQPCMGLKRMIEERRREMQLEAKVRSKERKRIKREGIR
jgi:hypothetical protein